MALRGLLPGIVIGACLLVAYVSLTRRDRHGLTLLSRVSARLAWVTSGRRRGVYRSGPLGRVPTARFALPGLGAALTVTEHRDAYERPFALIRSASGSTYTLVLDCSPEGRSLVDEDVIDSRVSWFGAWLASLGEEPGLVSATVTVETTPGSGHRLRGAVEARIDPGAPALAAQIVRSVSERDPVGSTSLRVPVALTFSAAAVDGGKKRSAEQMAVEIASRLPYLTQGLEVAGGGSVRPASSASLAERVRSAYDPDARSDFEVARAAGEAANIDWADAGPAAHDVDYSGYRHDGAYSVTWAMTCPPRGLAQSGTLGPLLEAHPDVECKRVTLLYRPIDPATSAQLAEADVDAARFNAGGGIGGARGALSVQQAESNASAEAAGAGMVNFAMLVTGTVRVGDEQSLAANRRAALAAITNLSSRSRVLLRVLHGSQDSAFVANLGLGLDLREHLAISADVRDRL